MLRLFAMTAGASIPGTCVGRPEPRTRQIKDRIICRDDLIKGGLCLEGVNEVIDRLWPIPAAMPISHAIRSLDEDEVAQFSSAISLNGNGNGYGYVNGNGDGYGYGNGDGYGYGNGNGDGYGDGNGYGYGYGDGYGDGD